MEIILLLLFIVGFIVLLCAAMTGAVFIKAGEIAVKAVRKKGKTND